MKFGQNLHETNTGNRIKPQFAATYRDSNTRVLNIFHPRNCRPCSKAYFLFLQESLPHKNFKSLYSGISSASAQGQATHRGNLRVLTKNMEDAVRIF
jgi:hypothetical protein